MKKNWTSLGVRSRLALAALALLAVAGIAALGAWTLQVDYRLLFGNLSERDAAVVTRQLDQMKVTYRIGSDGRSVLVDGDSVHATRLKLMGADAALGGAVGFELFDNSDFGATEFAQKVNYQRALQGEITRTILSLSEVESARVHLALPEEGLFRRAQNKPKASITLGLRDGQSVRREQVAGIRRLVAAAVSGVSADDVTIIDQHGVALSGSETADGALPASQRFDVKREIELHLAQKATQVLESAYGAGQAMASVDASIDMSQVRTTTEDVLVPPARKGAAPSGVVHRERETVREEGGGGTPAQSQREIDYQLGRRVEQVISTPGSIIRLQVVAVLKTSLNAAQVSSVEALLGASVGAVRERGDTIVVHSIDGLAATAMSPPPVIAHAQAASAARSEDSRQWLQATPRSSGPSTERSVSAPVLWAAAFVLVGAACASLAMRRNRKGRPEAARVGSLSTPDRQAMLGQIQAWLEPEIVAKPSRPEPRT